MQLKMKFQWTKKAKKTSKGKDKEKGKGRAKGTKNKQHPNITEIVDKLMLLNCDYPEINKQSVVISNRELLRACYSNNYKLF